MSAGGQRLTEGTQSPQALLLSARAWSSSLTQSKTQRTRSHKDSQLESLLSDLPVVPPIVLRQSVLLERTQYNKSLSLSLSAHQQVSGQLQILEAEMGLAEWVAT